MSVPDVAPAYAELHCLSNYSFLRGASHPEELVREAHALGYAALAVTDDCSLAGVVRAHQEAKACGLHLIIGAEVRLEEGAHLVLLAMDRTGYGALSELITQGRRRAAKGAYRLRRADLGQGLERCLAIWLPGEAAAGRPVEVEALAGPSPASADPGSGGDGAEAGGVTQAERLGAWLAAGFPGRAWIGVELHRRGGDRERLERLRALGAGLGLPLAACGGVRMHVRGRRPLLDTLTAIRLNRPLARLGWAAQSNGECHLRSRDRLARFYPPELLQETVKIAEQCRFSLDELRYEYPDELVPAGLTPALHLRRLTEAGARRRWPAGMPEKVRGLVERELGLIAELRYEPYFLTVHDIVRFARSRGILCQGRGSAANSAVCYCLGITEVDPARMQMLFERFISKERDEPPDIDVDFEHQRREEVIQYIYNQYGRDRAALAAAVISYRPKSALRDVGKALGLDADQLERLAGRITGWDRKELAEERLREAGLAPESPSVRLLLELSAEILGFPRHLSQHVGGFVISRGPLSRLVPIENAAMAERTVIQWDKNDLEALGLLKVDCLALGMLSAIHRAFDLINGFYGWRREEEGRQHKKPHKTDPESAARHLRHLRHLRLVPPPGPPFGPGRPLGLHNVPAEDPETYAMIQRAETVGVFQIESRAQMAMLPRLRPACFYDLVIEVALVRPGPIQGDMVHPYLRRRQGLEPVAYPSEAVRAVLGRTLGVPIFQEQVIKVAMVAAGFSPGEADQLRRSIAAWRRRGSLEQFEQRLLDGMVSRGYAEGFARQLYQQILGFGEYGFPESHAASFALLVYCSAWLKRHHPAAFFAALFNSQPMGFYAPAQLVQDARRMGVALRPADAAQSHWDCTLERSEDGAPALRLGLRLVRGLSQAGGRRLAHARQEGAFASVTELARRAHLNKADLQALAAANALVELAGHRRRALWQVTGIEDARPLLPDSQEIAAPLLTPPAEGQEIAADYASLGLTLGRHPLALLRGHLHRRGVRSAAEVRAWTHGRCIRSAGIVITRQRPSSANQVTFVTLEDESGQVNLVVWERLAVAQRRVLLGARLLGVWGEVQREGEVVHLIARRLYDYSELLGELSTRSRDFH